MDIFEILVNALITGVTISSITYATMKLMYPYIKSDIKQDMEKWLNSETGQKALFTIGGMIAQGAKVGFGIQKQGGKFGLNDLAMQILGRFFGGKPSGNNAEQKPQDQIGL